MKRGPDMYDFSAPLFYFKFVFLFEILVAETLLVYRVKRRPHFARRAAIAAAGLLLFTFALPIPYYNALYSSAIFILIFTATLAALKFCLDTSWGNVVYYGFFSYNEQHISFQIYSLACLPLDINANNNLYGNEMGDFADGLQILVFIVPHVLVYLVCWAFFKLREQEHGGREFRLRNTPVFSLAIAIVFVNVILNAFVVYDLPAGIPEIVNYFIIFYNILGCVFALVMLVSIVGRKEAESELKIVESLWHKNEEIYELSKVNVDFINMKCHDLRHRIRSIRQREFADEGELEEIEHAIDIYDGMLKTGNEVLDVILSEESIFCSENNIKLVCVIDGALLNFMRQADLYSIFQNGIHNAVDAALKLEETEKRIIRVTVKRVAAMISVHMENYIADGETIEFADGLPLSSKGEKDYHGFGMRSMRMSVEKYGGVLCVDVKDDIFSVDIMLPVPAAQRNAPSAAAGTEGKGV